MAAKLTNKAIKSEPKDFTPKVKKVANWRILTKEDLKIRVGLVHSSRI